MRLVAPLLALALLEACSPSQNELAPCATEVRVSSSGEVSMGGRVLLREPWEELMPLIDALGRLSERMPKHRRSFWRARTPVEPLRVRADDAAPYRAVAAVFAACRSRWPMLGSAMLLKTTEQGETGMWIELPLEIGVHGSHFFPGLMLAIERPGSAPVIHTGRLLGEGESAPHGRPILVDGRAPELLHFISAQERGVPTTGRVTDEDYEQVEGLWIAAAPDVPWVELDRVIENAKGHGTELFRFDVLVPTSD